MPHTDIEALTESTGAGYTIHGDVLFAEVIEVDEEDPSSGRPRQPKPRNGRDLNPRTP